MVVLSWPRPPNTVLTRNWGWNRCHLPGRGGCGAWRATYSSLSSGCHTVPVGLWAEGTPRGQEGSTGEGKTGSVLNGEAVSAQGHKPSHTRALGVGGQARSGTGGRPRLSGRRSGKICGSWGLAQSRARGSGPESSVTPGQRVAGQLSFFRRGWGAEASSGNSAHANEAPTSLEMKGWRGAASGG